MDFPNKILSIPSGSHFERLINCRASHAMSIQARRLGQVAHEDSEAARQGVRIHEARHTGNVEQLSAEERELFEILKEQEQTLLSQWIVDSFPMPEQRSEVRLYLRREDHLFPILTGQPDLVFVQGGRALIVDCKLGRNRVIDPCENWQLKIYAVLLLQTETYLEEVTVQILSPHFDFEPFTYTREELDRLHQSVLVVLSSLADPGEPAPGPHCQFCPARLICPAARSEAQDAALARVIELPLGEGAALLLSQIKRAKSLFSEIESFYRRLLEREPGAIPGFALEPGAVRRSIEDPIKAFEQLIELFSVQEFLSCCSVSVPELECSLARKKGVPATQTKELFKKFLGNLLVEKRNAPSLKPV
jgi:CRISPR/Cas system-associated exonuclease Cas4 (RecB family)